MMPQTVIFYQFKNEYGLEASDVNAYVAIASIPYSLKIIYGIMVDTLRIGKSRYKSFIFIYSILQIISSQVLFWFRIPREDLWITVTMLALNWLCVSALDLIGAVILIHQA
jgi:hypothetical protein